MAVVIPESLLEKCGGRSAEIAVARRLHETLPEDCRIWFSASEDRSRPRFVLLSPGLGTVGIDVHDWSDIDVEQAGQNGAQLAGLGHVDPVGDLGRRLQGLRSRLNGRCGEVPIAGVLVFPNMTRQGASAHGLDPYLNGVPVAMAEDVADDGLRVLLGNVGQQCPEPLLEEARRVLYPEAEFSKVRLVSDGDRAKRVSQRIFLDHRQESAARSLGHGLTLISGPAGSGKSLVLCARARLLAAEHPDWEIRVLCFNKTLAPYLLSLIGQNLGNVRVSTFHSWAYGHGIRLPGFRSSADSDPMDEVITKAEKRGRHRHTLDACLIDEGQDFHPGWLKLAAQAVRPSRGGLALAIDSAQSIYSDEAFTPRFEGFDVTAVHLNDSYRSTGSIGQFALSSVFGSHVSTDPGVQSTRVALVPRFAADGPPVQMVWAETWDAQAEFVAREIRRLIDTGQASYRDIAILYTQYRGMVHRNLSELEAAEIPVFFVNRDRESKKQLDLAENSVKLMTVHSAKGLEFPVVFLFGVEALKVGQDIKNDDVQGAQLTRLAYVGMTRAQNVLYLTYTRKNPIVERALRAAPCCEFSNWPDDFED